MSDISGDITSTNTSINDIPPAAQKLYYTQLLHLYTEHYGEPYQTHERLGSHGSDRFITRLSSPAGTCVGIVNPHLNENKAFLSFCKTLSEIGINAPEIYITADDEGSYLLEDLGDETLHNRINSDWDSNLTDKINLYKRVLDILPKIQIEMIKHADQTLFYQFAEFGSENIDFDINYFKDRFLKVFCPADLNEELLDKDLEYLKNVLLEVPRDFFMYRDFQSRNIMLHKDELYFIDFQSGRRGTLLYDAASFLYEAKANMPQDLREELLEYYLDRVLDHILIDKDFYREHFWYFAMIRILQAMGAYGYLGIVKGRQRFFASIPYAVQNINYILDNKIPHGELTYMKNIFKELENIDINKIITKV